MVGGLKGAAAYLSFFFDNLKLQHFAQARQNSPATKWLALYLFRPVHAEARCLRGSNVLSFCLDKSSFGRLLFVLSISRTRFLCRTTVIPRRKSTFPLLSREKKALEIQQIAEALYYVLSSLIFFTFALHSTYFSFYRKCVFFHRN